MSRRRELIRRLTALDDIAGILAAMRGLALMEIRSLQTFLPAQGQMLRTIERAAADFLETQAAAETGGETGAEICVLVGSEQGFCGDFNERIVQHWRRRAPRSSRAEYVAVGHHLTRRIECEHLLAGELPGASVADEIPNVLLRLTQTLNALSAREDRATRRIAVVYHCIESHDIRERQILPMRPGVGPSPAGRLPELQLPAPEFRTGLTHYYLHAVLNQVLYSSLLAENRRRHAQMERALDKLDEERSRLRLAYHTQRQEDITEEIEVILLSIDGDVQ